MLIFVNTKIEYLNMLLIRGYEFLTAALCFLLDMSNNNNNNYYYYYVYDHDIGNDDDEDDDDGDNNNETS